MRTDFWGKNGVLAFSAKKCGHSSLVTAKRAEELVLKKLLERVK